MRLCLAMVLFGMTYWSTQHERVQRSGAGPIDFERSRVLYFLNLRRCACGTLRTNDWWLGSSTVPPSSRSRPTLFLVKPSTSACSKKGGHTGTLRFPRSPLSLMAISYPAVLSALVP